MTHGTAKPDAALAELVAMSNHLGAKENDYSIIGEGNTSTTATSDSFWVKASGSELRTATAASFIRLSTPRALAMLQGPQPTDAQVTQWLTACKCDLASTARPSTEALLHAVCLASPGVRFVGHTHPTAVNALTCATSFEKLATVRLFPDHVVVCGPAPLLVAYIDPGVPLARELHRGLQMFIARHGHAPKEILLQGHGLIALGASSREVENITAMSVKAHRILAGTFAFGGPNFMKQTDIDRIHGRSDEAYRQRVFGG